MGKPTIEVGHLHELFWNKIRYLSMIPSFLLIFSCGNWSFSKWWFKKKSENGKKVKNLLGVNYLRIFRTRKFPTKN